jgi:VanZ family protein
MRRRFKYIWPAFVWAIAISIFSSKYFSSSYTAGIIIPILHFLFPHASKDTLFLMHHLIRKSAHFIEYFILSLLLLRAVRGDRQGFDWRWALSALAMAAAYAAMDELHQLFVPGRTASPWDVLLDTSGVVVAQLWAAWRFRGGRPGDTASLAHDDAAMRREVAAPRP